MITKLNNPKTELYYQLKNLILSTNFPWYYWPISTDEHENYINISYYGHIFLCRPEPSVDLLFPKVTSSENIFIINNFLASVARENNFKINCLYRINANACHPIDTEKLTVPHYDHEFPHKNLLIYLNDAGGETVVFNDDKTFTTHHPQEDDIIIFDGLHCFKPPKKKRRLVLVATFI